MVVASTLCHEVDIVEIGDWEDLGRVGVVGSFETGDVHVEDFVALEVAGCFAGEDAEE